MDERVERHLEKALFHLGVAIEITRLLQEPIEKEPDAAPKGGQKRSARHCRASSGKEEVGTEGHQGVFPFLVSSQNA